MSESASAVVWRRLRYMLSPQFDLYQSLAPLVAGKAVLDVGFGTGLGTLQLAAMASVAAGIEVDPLAVEFARTCLPGVTWVEGDLLDDDIQAKLPQPTWDAVTLVEVLEHIPDWTAALGAVTRLLVPGGALYVTARNANADLRRNELHEREWTGSELRQALASAFGGVLLYDVTMGKPLGDDTRVTPLIALAWDPAIFLSRDRLRPS